MHLTTALLTMSLMAGGAPPASISGSVVTSDGAALPECVVYLEPADPKARFDLPSKPVVISQKGAQFSPPLLIISVGQSVEFRNDEEKPIEHNVFSRSAVKIFDLGLYPPPQNKLVRFDKPGAVRLFCSIHRFMDGQIYVCPSPFFAKTNPDGSFRIQNIPSGAWRVRTWQRKARYRDADIPITTADGLQEIQIELTR